jgi:transposase
MMRTYLYRMHPNAGMSRILIYWLWFCRLLYNAALEQRSLYAKRLKTLVDPERLERDDQGEVILDDKGKSKWKPNPAAYYGQCAQLTTLRQADRDDAKCLVGNIEVELRAEGRTDPEIAEFIELLDVKPKWWNIPVEVLRSPLKRLQHAFDAFFRRLKSGEGPGYPRFRSAKRYDSLDVGRVTVKKDRVFIPKLGHVKMNLYRPIEGEIRNATIRRGATNKWWISFSCDVGEAPVKLNPADVTEDRTVGIDLGITDLVTLSTGEPIPNPRFTKKAADRLARQQRTLARKQKGSKNRGFVQVWGPRHQ